MQQGAWWTRTQRIRTAAELPLEAMLLDTNTAPLYQRIAPTALRLSQLGLGAAAISRKLNVDGKTVAKGVAWLRDQN
jgi:hypothetical protein